IRVHPGAHLLPLEPGAVLFCERSQNLYALNGAAALCWSGLAQGLGEADIVAALVAAGAPAAAAPAWYRDSLDMFRLRGLLAGTEPPTPVSLNARPVGAGRPPAGAPSPAAAPPVLRAFDRLMEVRAAPAPVEPG